MEYILVLLIVALLNGAIAYIDGLMEGIVPLTLYAEQYMSTLAGVDLFEALFDIVFGFGVSLIILKFLKKGFETYVNIYTSYLNARRFDSLKIHFPLL